MRGMSVGLMGAVLALYYVGLGAAVGAAPCGGVLGDPRGVLHTPGFPGAFPTPLRCRWIVDSSGWPNSTLLLYLAQVFVTSGLSFTEYVHYEEGLPQYQLGRRELRPPPGAAWLRSTTPYLVVEFALDSLEGAHLRALGPLMHVYGFNITYEAGTGQLDPERTGACSVAACSFSGHCYASHDYSQFRCACFDGFSGEDCGLGPLCRSGQHDCTSEDDCRQLGSRVVRCRHQCVFGQTCPDSTETTETDCGSEECVYQCPYQQGDPACKCDHASRVLTDRARYYATIRLANLTSVKNLLRHSSLPFQSTLEKQILRYLRSSLTNITELKVLEVTSLAEIKFHFFAAKRDGSRVRDLLNRLVERGKLGNFTLLPTHIALKQEQTLFLKSVSATPESGSVRPGEPFVLGCAAYGSSAISFRWFKDGDPVNASTAMRSIAVEQLPPDGADRHVSLLRVRRAEPLDDGTYTCQAVDWGAQQCRSLRLPVPLPPSPLLYPRTLAARKGQNISIVCMSPNDGLHEKYGYSWAKGKSLLRLSPGREVWEDLHPMGSILNVYNIQRSAVYKCVVHSSFASQEAVSEVEVVDRSVVPMCPAEELLGTEWPEAVPHAHSLVDCPAPYTGTASRLCLLPTVGRAAWQLPDLSGCSDPQLARVRDNFVKLTLGYESTTAPDTIAHCLHYLQRMWPLLPGMGEPVVDLLSATQRFLDHSRLQQELLASSKAFTQAVDLLLDDKLSLRSDKSLIQLQEMIQFHGTMSASQLPDSSSWWTNLTSVVMEVAFFDRVEWFDYQVSPASHRYPAWMTDELDVHVEAAIPGARNDTFTMAVIIYKNLSQFTPQRNMFRLRSGQELYYEINSHVIAMDLQQDGQKIVNGIFSISLQFNSVFKTYDAEEWDAKCAMTQYLSMSHPWDLGSCLMERPRSLHTVWCRCSRPGTYAVLLTSRVTQAGAVEREPHHVVLLGCVFCLLQTVFTLLLLLPYWWRHRSCIIYLKLQCCTATSGAMGIFIYAVRDSIPKRLVAGGQGKWQQDGSWDVLYKDYPRGNFPYVTSSLEVLLLIGMSSHLSKVLVVYTEVVQLSKIRCFKQTVSSIITVVPVLAVVSSHLAHDTTGWPLKSWWLLFGTMMFNMFVTSMVIMTLLFAFLFCIVMQRLQLISRKALYENKSITRRVGFLKRGATIFSFMVVMEASSVCYINFHAKTYHYMFSLSSALLGFIIFVCYVWKSETPVCIQLLNRLKLGDGSQNKYSSDTAYSPFKLFAKQEGDVEAEGAPPWSGRSQSQAEDAEQSQGLLMTESGVIRAPLPDVAPCTVETYGNSADSSFIDGDLTNTSRKELCNQLDDTDEGRDEQDTISTKTGSFRYLGTVEVSPKPCTGSEQAVINKVCVELGVITSHEDGGITTSESQVIPAIILCSVDVEPCHQEATVPPSGMSFTLPMAAQCKSTPPQSPEIQTHDATGDELIIEEQGPQPIKTVPAQGRSGVDELTPEPESDNIDCMLNRISHDLDYLLNRKTQLGQVQQAKSEQCVLSEEKCTDTFQVR